MELRVTWSSLISHRNGELIIPNIQPNSQWAGRLLFVVDDNITLEETVQARNDGKTLTFVSNPDSKHMLVFRLALDPLSGIYCGTYTSLYPMDQGHLTAKVIRNKNEL